MPSRSHREVLAPTRLISALSSLSAQAQARKEYDQFLRIQRLAEALRSCGPPKTPSEAEFVKVVKRNGQFSLELVIICAFTLWYTGILLVHLYSFNMEFMVAVRCRVPALEDHFDFDQIINISVKNHESERREGKEYCHYDLRNYTDLLERHKYNYKAIMEEINNESNNPAQKPCYKYVIKSPQSIFTGDMHGQRKHCIRDEFSLFCDRRKWHTYMLDIRKIAMGVSAAIVGLASDIHGRKPTFVLTSLLHLLSYAIMVLPSKWGMLLGRFIFGCGEPSHLAIFTLFAERCNKTTRVCMANLVLIVYPISHCAAYLLCQIMPYWRSVIFANMSMLLALPFGIWYLVESPRWLMFTRKRAAAWKALQAYGADVEPNVDHLAEPPSSSPTIKSVMRYFTLSVYRKRVKACIVLFTLGGLIMDIGVRINKPFQYLFGWPYYLLYVLFQVIASMLGYVLSIIAGAQKTLFLFFMTLGIVDVILLVQRVKYEDHVIIFGLVLIHKTLGRVVYCIITYYVNELFPTPCRVTAMGVCMGLYWIGRVVEGHIVAPLTELSPYLNHLPALVATITCALVVSFLPNTQTEVLADKPYDSVYESV